MTLEEMLALLPDNNAGEIDAADLRAVVTGLFETIETNLLRITALENSGSGGSTVTGYWQINPQEGVVPGGKQMTSEHGFVGTSSWLRFDPVDKLGTDCTHALMNSVRIFVQQQQNADNWTQYEVTGPGTDSDSYVEVPVSKTASSGSTVEAAWQDAVVVIKVAPSENP